MHGLYLLWWVEERQLPPAVVAVMLAAGDVAILALELPTGWLADRVGHRASLIAGSAAQVLGMLWCWLGDGVTGLLIASLLVAIGDALRSGADQALLYRSCAAAGDVDAFQRLESRASAAESVSLIVFVLLGGVLVRAGGFAAGWIAEVLLCAAGLACACAMREPPAMVAAGAGAHAASGWDGVFTRPMFELALPAAVVGSLAGAASFLAQTSGAHDPATVSVMVAAFAAAECAGAMMASRWRVGAGHLRGLAVTGALIAVVTIFLPPALAASAVVLSWLSGVAGPLRAAAIQRLARDEGRARAASLAGACDTALSSLLLPLAGVWRGRR